MFVCVHVSVCTCFLYVPFFTFYFSAYEGFIRCLYQEIKKAGCTDDVGLGYLGYMVIYGTPPGIDFSIEDFNEIIKTEVVRYIH